jgi:uncharacterized delta-60 repeat protein
MKVTELNPPMIWKNRFLLQLCLALLSGKVLAQLGAPDPSFNPLPAGSVVGSTANSPQSVNVILRQDDGKIIIGGRFLNVCPARFNADGTPDPSFNVGAGVRLEHDPRIGPLSANGEVYAMLQQLDGKIIIGGFFNQVNGYGTVRLARLNTNGVVDTTFYPCVSDYGVSALAFAANGKILVGGSFTFFNGVIRSGFARLDPNGGPDLALNQGSGANGEVRAIAPVSGGGFLIGGSFNTVNGIPRKAIARISNNGSLDNVFVSPVQSGIVQAIQVQTNGKILLAGSLQLGRSSASTFPLVRLNADGTLDRCFELPSQSPYSSWGVALEPDGKICAVGDLLIAGQERGAARFFPDGSLDSSFVAPNLPQGAYCVARQSDGKFLVGGSFWNVDSGPGYQIVRLLGGEAQNLGTPKLKVPCLCETGGLILPLLSDTNKNFLIQTSSNLVNWADWTNGVTVNTMTFFSDPQPTLPRRFYRLSP